MDIWRIFRLLGKFFTVLSQIYQHPDPRVRAQALRVWEAAGELIDFEGTAETIADAHRLVREAIKLHRLLSEVSLDEKAQKQHAESAQVLENLL